jgi:tRNA (cytidine/uridine-2'-O-)-methyltransferase
MQIQVKGERTLNIVLVEPQIPQNTGNIARTCAATGARLHLIKPMGFAIDDKKLKRAGLDYWQYLDITYYENLDDFMQKNPDHSHFYYLTTKGHHIYSQVNYSEMNEVYLFFGREDAGLPESLLYENEANSVRVPMLPGIRSLNLSNTVALEAYEVLRQWEFEKMQCEGALTKYDWPYEF